MKMIPAAILAILVCTRIGAPAKVPDAAPLPSLDTVLQGVSQRAAREDQDNKIFNQTFFYVRTKTSDYRNSAGQLKKSESSRGTNSPVVIAIQPTPAPVPPPPVAPSNSQPVSDTHSNVRGKALDKKDFLLNGDLLKRFDFVLSGRETINERPALIIDFKPSNKKWPEHGLKDRFINLAAGRVWVDESDYTMVKADLHLTATVNVWGGLAGAVWKFNYSFDRERTSSGLWFTREVNWHLEGREVVVTRVVDYHEETTQVRPTNSTNADHHRS